MAQYKSNFASVVAIGGQNPQILNVDFLKEKAIVPIDKPPFNELYKQEKPFQDFVSTPPFSRLVMNNYEFIVDGQRFQVKDNKIEDWSQTLIYQITANYYSLLEHSPLKVIGLNFNSRIIFETDDEMSRFQNLFLTDENRILDVISQHDVSGALELRFPLKGNRGILTIGQQKQQSRIVNLNYEFDFQDIEGMKRELEDINTLTEYYTQIISSLIEAL